MGNKPVHNNQRTYRCDIKNICSDDSYLPVTKEIKRVLIEGKRFHQVGPYESSLKESERPHILKSIHYNDSNSSPKFELKKTVSFKILPDDKHGTANNNAKDGIMKNMNLEKNKKQHFGKSTSTSSMKFIQTDQKKSIFTGIGNKPVHNNQRTYRCGIKNICSDDSYLPVTKEIKRALIEGKRFHQVAPPESSLKESEHPHILKPINSNDSNSSPNFELNKTVSFKSLPDDKHGTANNNSKDRIMKNMNLEKYEEELFRKPTSTSSMKYFQMDQKKSSFTMQLEERLRQSKRELGFDTDLNSLKEFVFKWDDTVPKKKSAQFKEKDNPREPNYHSISKELATLSSSELLAKKSSTSIGKTSNVQLKDTKYSTHNCQILGLCNVGRPQVPKFSSHMSNDQVEMSIDNNVSVANQKVGKHDKDYCNCELCTLAYLTDMRFPSKCRSPSSRKNRTRKPTKASIHRKIQTKNSDTERIRIVECGDGFRSVDISVNGSALCKGIVTEASSRDSNCSKISVRTLQHDCTNEKIRKMFEQNNKSPSFSYVDRGRLDSNEICSQDMSNGKESKVERSKTISRVNMDNKAEIFKKETAIPSSSTLTSSITSSLSSVMSYKRVRILFESIINKNKSRKRPRKNLNKFKEMEELGLGKLKHNHWYPSDNKTYSIWSNLHSKFNGVEAEFKKYPKIIKLSQ